MNRDIIPVVVRKWITSDLGVGKYQRWQYVSVEGEDKGEVAVNVACSACQYQGNCSNTNGKGMIMNNHISRQGKGRDLVVYGGECDQCQTTFWSVGWRRKETTNE